MAIKPAATPTPDLVERFAAESNREGRPGGRQRTDADRRRLIDDVVEHYAPAVA